MATKLALPQDIPPSVSDEVWEEAGWLPCLLSVDLAIRRFTVRGEDVPVLVNSHLVGWAEFEAIGERLAVRLTDLA